MGTSAGSMVLWLTTHINRRGAGFDVIRSTSGTRRGSMLRRGRNAAPPRAACRTGGGLSRLAAPRHRIGGANCSPPRVQSAFRPRSMPMGVMCLSHISP